MGRSRFAVLAAVIALSSCGWTQYAGNAGRTGFAPFESTLTTANANQAVVKWRGTRYSGAPVVNDGMIYGAADAELHAWNLAPANCSGSPLTCPPTWWSHTADFATSAPVVVGDTVYIAGAGASEWHLDAFDAHGRGDCTSSPPQGCLPKWVGKWGSVSSGGAYVPFLAASDGKVFVQTFDPSTSTSDVTAFDAAGTDHCRGTPLVCTPLFHAPLRHGDPNLQPSVDGTRLFVATGDGVSVFDATGSEGCVSGACVPLFQLFAPSGGEVAVSNGQAFTTAGDQLFAFDSSGITNCGGTPVVCQPIWRGTLTAATNRDAPIIAGDRVFVNSIGATGLGAIEAFDRSAGASCAGSPLACPRLFRTQTGITFDRAHAVANANLLVVVSGSLPFQMPQGLAFELSFFDLHGTVNCTGAPKVCAPVATLPLGTDATGTEQVGRPALGAGLVVVPHLSDSPLIVGLP